MAVNLIYQYFSTFNTTQNQQITGLEQVYREWNEKINVISRKDIDSLYLKHVLHALSIAAVFDFKPGSSILDIGTGGGFPGVPLAIFFPEVEFMLVDSIAKKLKVVDAVCESLQIKNIQTRHSRVEEIKTEKFDTVVSRAVAPLTVLWQWSKPLLRKNNQKDAVNGLICLKGGDLNVEIADSGLRPKIFNIKDIFDEEWFEEKYMLYARF